MKIFGSSVSSISLIILKFGAFFFSLSLDFEQLFRSALLEFYSVFFIFKIVEIGYDPKMT